MTNKDKIIFTAFFLCAIFAIAVSFYTHKLNLIKEATEHFRASVVENLITEADINKQIELMESAYQGLYLNHSGLSVESAK